MRHRVQETGAKVSAKDAGSRLSYRASRHFSVGGRSKSFRLENGRRDGLDRSSSTQGSNKEVRFDDEVDHFEGDNVRVPSDIEEKEEEPGKRPSGIESPPLTPVDETKKIPETLVLTPPAEVAKPSKLRPMEKDKKWDPKKVNWARLHQALLDKKWEEAVWLIDQKVNINGWKGITGETTLHEALMRRAPSKVIKALIARGANVNATTMVGLSPLHSAVMYSPSSNVIEVLLHSGANVNLGSKKGMTPLMAAVLQGRALEILALLIRHGADPLILDAEGKRAVDHAKEKKPAAINMLENISGVIAFAHKKPPGNLTKEVLARVRKFLY